MRLRSITKHVGDQNWFAVFLDFAIVVGGVFVGLQVANWSDVQSGKAEYYRALERLNVETISNLATLDGLDVNTERGLKLTGRAIGALKSCAESEENQQAVSAGLRTIMGTYGIPLRRTALEDLTTNSRLLAQQSTQERQRFTDMLFYFDLMQREAGYIETIPLAERMQNNPIIGFDGWSEIRSLEYFGAEYSRPNRELTLNVPMNIACKNNQLIKSFYTWEYWQSVLPAISRQLRKELEMTQSQLQVQFEAYKK